MCRSARDFCASTRQWRPRAASRSAASCGATSFPLKRNSITSLADRNHHAYAVADPNDPTNVMTVRDSVEGPRRIIPRNQWGFARDDNGSRTADATRVYMSAKFEPNKIYEVVYTAENPPLVGLGPAAVRDTISMLKYKSADALSIPAGTITRAMAFGVSQSGRFLRTYLYDGFNRSEDNRKVFDGVMAHVAGAGRGSFNHRFAQPSRDGHPYLNFFYPTDVFPFTDVAQKDPETGVTDGLLTHPGSPELLPKVFYTNSVVRVLGPRRVADSHDGRRHLRRTAVGQRSHLSAVRGPARARGIPADADHRAAEEQSA